MFTGISLTILIAFVGVFTYKQSRLEQRLIKDISLVDWMGILVYPLIAYIGMAILIKTIFNRPRVEILDYDDFTILVVGIPFLIYAFVGNSVHFVSKVLSRHIKQNSHSIVFQINEIFHGKFSHYLTAMSTFLTIFVVLLFEINHPLIHPLAKDGYRFMVLSGFLLGIPVARSIFYTSDWFRGNRALFILVVLLLLSAGGLFIALGLNPINYPVSVVIVAMWTSYLLLFILRRILVLYNYKKRWSIRLIARILLLS